MAIGFSHAKDDGSFAEDLFVFEENIGLTCYYRGSQEDALPEYAGTHHATIVLKEFLPDLQKELANIRQEIKDMANSPRVDYVSDEQFELEMQQITDDFNEQVRSFTAAHGNSSAPQVFAMAAQREATKKRATLKAKKAVSDRFYKQTDEPAPEISLIIIAQANNNKFDVTLINNSGRHLVAEEINVGGVKTELNQQFLHQYPLQQVNCPEGIFDNELNGLDVTVRYRTLDGKQYELLQQGRQEHRAGDGRYNLIFPGPASIKAL